MPKSVSVATLDPLIQADSQAAIAAVPANIRRLMAREGLTYEELIEASGLDERTIRSLLRGINRPHARTLHKLAAGLGVQVDELFSLPYGYSSSAYDHACNPIVDEILDSHPEIFADWSEADFDELASRFGTGGHLTEEGALEAARAMNRKRQVLHQVAVIMETHEAPLLTDLVEVIYRRVTAKAGGDKGPIRSLPTLPAVPRGFGRTT